MDELSPERLAAKLPDRPLRSYPALVSTEADALAWARAGGPEGAVVVADYQVAPRGWADRVWELRPGESLGFSMVLRPALPPEREGWLYTVAASGLAAAVCTQFGSADPAAVPPSNAGPSRGPGDVAVGWPDEVFRDGRPVGAVGVHTEFGPRRLRWAVVSLALRHPETSRATALAAAVRAVEDRCRADPAAVLDEYRARCLTIGRQVRARLVPVGPSGPAVTGIAVDCLDDGALVIETRSGNRVAVRPQHVGRIEEAL